MDETTEPGTSEVETLKARIAQLEQENEALSRKQARVIPCLPPTENEPIFLLRAQDLSADLTIAFWAEINALMQGALQHGQNPYGMVDSIRGLLPALLIGHKRYPQKIVDAQAIAKAMAAWTPRKPAD